VLGQAGRGKLLKRKRFADVTNIIDVRWRQGGKPSKRPKIAAISGRVAITGDLGRWYFRLYGPLWRDGQFTSNIFNLYDKWAQGDYHEHAVARRSIARGEQLFNTLQIPISGVAGINDDVAAGGLVAGGIPLGTCGTCHDTPNLGNHSFPTPLNIGTGDPSPDHPGVNLGGLDLSYLPEITVCKKDLTGGLTNDCKTTLISDRLWSMGSFAHIGKIKGPIVRGLAARAPYFHNGSAATLLDAVNFYETRLIANHLHLRLSFS
jgi:hypothetical protein